MLRTRHSTDFFSSPWREFTDRHTPMDATTADLVGVLIEPATDAPDGRRW